MKTKKENSISMWLAKKYSSNLNNPENMEKILMKDHLRLWHSAIMVVLD